MRVGLKPVISSTTGATLFVACIISCVEVYLQFVSRISRARFVGSPRFQEFDKGVLTRTVEIVQTPRPNKPSLPRCICGANTNPFKAHRSNTEYRIKCHGKAAQARANLPRSCSILICLDNNYRPAYNTRGRRILPGGY